MTERDDTLVAQALATSSEKSHFSHVPLSIWEWAEHTGTVVVCLQQGKERADGEDVGVFLKDGHLGDVKDKQRLC